MMDNPRYSISELKLHLGKFPDSVRFQCWKVNFKTEACANSPCPTLTISWIKEEETANSMDDLMTSQSIEGRRDFPDFDTPDAKIASALRKIICNWNFRRRVSVEEQLAQKHDRFHRGRQIANTIYDHSRATGADDAAQGLLHLLNICLRDDDIEDFDTRWDQAPLGTSELPHENVLEGLYKLKKKRDSIQLQTKKWIEIGHAGFRTTSNSVGFVQSRIESR